MAARRLQGSSEGIWALAERQHGVVTRGQLIGLGMSPGAIGRRTRNGRLHPVRRGVYAVGRPQLSREGGWVAAALSCGPEGVTSHLTAAAVWGIRRDEPAAVHVSVPLAVLRKRPGLVVHRRTLLPRERTDYRGVPVTSLVLTLVDLAGCVGRASLERAVNEANVLGLIGPDAVGAALARYRSQRGVAALRSLLGAGTFLLTDSELERRFLPLARAAGLPPPQTQVIVNGFRVDFFWPSLGIVVETDGLRYHGTQAQQSRDLLRDATHTAAGLRPLRFSHSQVRYEPALVERALRAALSEALALGRGGS